MATEINVNVKQDFINLKSQTIPPETQAEGIFFLNELDNLPKYREPNNGKIYNLSTTRYVSKNCVFEEPGDNNGLFYWLLTDYGGQAWTLTDIPTIAFSWSGAPFEEQHNDRTVLYSKDIGTFAISNAEFNYIALDFTFPQKFSPSGLLLRSPHVEQYGFLRNYVIFMQEEGYEDYILYSNVQDSNQLVGVNSFIYISVPSNTRKLSRLFIQQTGVNSIGTHSFALGGIELYGKFI